MSESERKHTPKEHWEVDRHGFNVIEVFDHDVRATVAVLQPHARIRERARVMAASHDMLEVLQEIVDQGLLEALLSMDEACAGFDEEYETRSKTFPCIASKCMAWRWGGLAPGRPQDAERSGYCGLSGRPS